MKYGIWNRLESSVKLPLTLSSLKFFRNSPDVPVVRLVKSGTTGAADRISGMAGEPGHSRSALVYRLCVVFFNTGRRSKSLEGIMRSQILLRALLDCAGRLLTHSSPRSPPVSIRPCLVQTCDTAAS